MPDQRQVRQSVVINASPQMVFEAVARASELREWCCEQAWTDGRPGGRYGLHWPSGYHTEGKITVLEPPGRLAVTWHAVNEPGETVVEFNIEPAAEAGSSRMTLIHSGFGAGSEWDETVVASEQGWRQGLENLKSTLETGIDLRIARRPFLGITFDVLNAERAAREGIAVQEGIYVLGTVDGSGARAAGLGKGDVITSIGGMATPGYHELGSVLGRQEAGNVVDMEVVRGQERHRIPVTLGSRPMEDLAATPAELAQIIAARYQEINADLMAALDGVSDEEASQRPSEGEWSVKEVLAHLTLGERDNQYALATVVTAGWLDNGPDNLPGRMTAVLTATPTLAALVNRFFTDEAETAAFLRELPADLAANKARFRRISLYMSFNPNHIVDHVEQIKATIQAVREGQAAGS